MSPNWQNADLCRHCWNIFLSDGSETLSLDKNCVFFFIYLIQFLTSHKTFCYIFIAVYQLGILTFLIPITIIINQMRENNIFKVVVYGKGVKDTWHFGGVCSGNRFLSVDFLFFLLSLFSLDSDTKNLSNWTVKKKSCWSCIHFVLRLGLKSIGLDTNVKVKRSSVVRRNG